MQLKYLYFTIYALGILSALWSVLRVFAADATTNQKHYLLLRIVSVSYWLFSIYSVYRAEWSFRYIPATLLATIGLIIFWWARRSIRGKGLALIYSKTAPAEIATDGPYRYIRHPFYTSYILIYFSAFVATPTWIQGTFCLILIGLYAFAARAEEAMLLSGPHAATYQEYYNQSGQFFPRLKSSNKETKNSKAS